MGALAAIDAERRARGPARDTRRSPTVQRAARDPAAAALRPSAQSLVQSVAASPGRPLGDLTRARLERRYRADFSTVRVHTDAQAEASADALGAHAFTTGEHIAFGAGAYAPETSRGLWILAHELAHVVQQRADTADPGEASERAAEAAAAGTHTLPPPRPGPAQAGRVVQRLIRTPYPWRGVITPPIGANLRRAPDRGDPTNIVEALPHGTAVDVLSASGQWLHVRKSGTVVDGFVHNALVDDASSAAMQQSVGTRMVWNPSNPTSGTDFQTWASAATETPFPAVTPTTVMNCWESVLLAAHRAGAVSWTWIHNLYTTTPFPADWETAMLRGARTTYNIPGPNPVMPQRGDLVFFNGIEHVALATGSGSNLYTFWPPPDTPVTRGGTPDRVKIFTIEALVAWWTPRYGAPKVEFGAPAW
jgi:hypothetical protein